MMSPQRELVRWWAHALGFFIPRRVLMLASKEKIAEVAGLIDQAMLDGQAFGERLESSFPRWALAWHPMLVGALRGTRAPWPRWRRGCSGRALSYAVECAREFNEPVRIPWSPDAAQRVFENACAAWVPKLYKSEFLGVAEVEPF